MKLLYEDLLSGDPIFIEGVGHLRPPLLSELKPSGIGIYLYNALLHYVLIKEEDFIESLSSSQAELFKKIDNVAFFQKMILKPRNREMLEKAFDYFIKEIVQWSPSDKAFIVLSEDKKKNDFVPTGRIDEHNFEEVRSAIAQLNYVVRENPEELVFASEKARQLWEETQSRMKKINEKTKNNSLRIGNIISKICALSTTYNYSNIYDLTIYQFYDLFFQMGYMRAMNLNERAFSNHGGDKFRFEDWMAPIS